MMLIPERRPVRSKVAAQKAAESLAWRLAASYPVDPTAIAEELGVKVVAGPPADSELSGALVLRDGRATIIYNSGHGNVRTRFTIAHELGHFLLHTDEGDEATLFRDSVSSLGTDKREVHANAFAAALLMPERFVRKVVSAPVAALDEAAIEKAASTFCVSTQAMTYRLADLGLYAPLY